jgi:hypothetical protein
MVFQTADGEVLKLEKGEIYAIELRQWVPQDSVKQIANDLNRLYPEVRFLLLSADTRLVRRKVGFLRRLMIRWIGAAPLALGHKVAV